jgi:hypothetical protein
VRHLMGISGDREASAQLTDRPLRAEISRKAQEYGRALSILDRIWDGRQAARHAEREGRPGTAAVAKDR